MMKLLRILALHIPLLVDEDKVFRHFLAAIKCSVGQLFDLFPEELIFGLRFHGDGLPPHGIHHEVFLCHGLLIKNPTSLVIDEGR